MRTPYYDASGITIYHGDCREILPTLEPVDLVLTDPPYNVANRPTHGLMPRWQESRYDLTALAVGEELFEEAYLVDRRRAQERMNDAIHRAATAGVPGRFVTRKQPDGVALVRVR